MGLAVEYVHAIDRFTYFGPVSGPNMLHTRRLDEPVRDDAYTFYGGCYTWSSPQGGVHGWRGPDGALRGWPPDRAMDTGPAVRSGRRINAFSMLSPVDARGLVETKSMRIQGSDGAELSMSLRNDSEDVVVAGCWVLTAADAGDVIAVRATSDEVLFGWDERAVGVFVSLLSEPDEAGWRTARLGHADWDGGLKVYVDGGSEIAIWRGSYWWYRRMLTPGNERLRDHGEGPVAIYIEPGAGIYEAQLYGPLVELAPGEEASAIEVWRLIRSAAPDVSRLPR